MEPKLLKKRISPIVKYILPSERHSAKDTVGSCKKKKEKKKQPTLEGPDEVYFETVKLKLWNFIPSNKLSCWDTVTRLKNKNTNAIIYKCLRHGGFSEERQGQGRLEDKVPAPTVLVLVLGQLEGCVDISV